MFQTLDRNGMYIPAELEVEHHLVSDFADGLMQAGTVFPLIRWCNPGNSRENVPSTRTAKRNTVWRNARR